ncbi:hypothetical protein ABMA27_016620 [Loxostege sticticalis]|uniref:Uncharacterized protein n=1 Tax=Loxostege sticticalis TaxID=481309 RepID=A0ABR3I306_LOXSC
MDRRDHPRHDSWFSAGDLWRLRTLSTTDRGEVAHQPRAAAHAIDAPCAKDYAAFMFAWGHPTTPPRPTRIRHSARSGGGRSFQHRDAANLKEPRNAAVRCLGVENMYVHSLLGLLAAHSSFS